VKLSIVSTLHCSAPYGDEFGAAAASDSAGNDRQVSLGGIFRDQAAAPTQS
jgi:hypothetical protein